MKGKHLFITALVMILAGVILIITSNSISSVKIVIAGGILFIVAGLANILFFTSPKPTKEHPDAVGSVIGWISSAAAIVLGLGMLLFQQTFIPLVSFMFAVLLLLAAIFQLRLLTFGWHPTKPNGLLFIIPMLLFGAAVFIYMQRSGHVDTDKTIMLVTGAAFVVFGLASIAEGIMIERISRNPQLTDTRNTTGAVNNNDSDKTTEP